MSHDPDRGKPLPEREARAAPEAERELERLFHRHAPEPARRLTLAELHALALREKPRLRPLAAAAAFGLLLAALASGWAAHATWGARLALDEPAEAQGRARLRREIASELDEALRRQGEWLVELQQDGVKRVANLLRDDYNRRLAQLERRLEALGASVALAEAPALRRVAAVPRSESPKED